MGKFQDLSGQKFGRLTVSHRSEQNTKDGKPMWVCKCECGCITIVPARRLKNGDTKSCGCLYWDSIKDRHNAGCKKHPLYRLFDGIKVRCYTKTDVHYPDYGGRGIKMCDEWLDDFWEFATYIENLPNYGKAGYSIDRIDVNGDYAPGNLRWASAKEQARNRRRHDLVTAFGKTQSTAEWAEEYGINYYTLWSRIHEQKWNPERALTTPVKQRERM